MRYVLASPYWFRFTMFCAPSVHPAFWIKLLYSAFDRSPIESVLYKFSDASKRAVPDWNGSSFLIRNKWRGSKIAVKSSGKFWSLCAVWAILFLAIMLIAEPNSSSLCVRRCRKAYPDAGGGCVLCFGKTRRIKTSFLPNEYKCFRGRASLYFAAARQAYWSQGIHSLSLFVFAKEFFC